MIEAKELIKSFGTVQAVRGVSFAVKRGEAVGFLGPNGAGKTTTFRMMAGTLAPDSGSVSVLGEDLFSAPISAKSKLGYMAENAPLYPELTTEQYLRYRAELRGIRRDQRSAAINLAAEKSGVGAMLKVQIGHLSKGYRQRAALADALLGDPPVLLLDEPTSGLDPNQVLETRQLIVNLASDHAVILSTHVLSEVEATCQRAVVIDQGRIVGQGTLSELKAGQATPRGEVHVFGQRSTLDALLEHSKVQGFKLSLSEETSGIFTLHVVLDQPDVLSDLIQKCIEAKLKVIKAGALSTPLDEVFSHLTRDGHVARDSPLNRGRKT